MSLIIDIKVTPSCGRQAWKLDKNGILHCYLKSAPEKNQANKELIAFMAKSLKINQRDIIIIAGATQRKKRIRITTSYSFEQLLPLLGIAKPEVQQTLF